MSTPEKSWRIYLCAGINCSPLSRSVLQRAVDDALWEFQLDHAVDLRMSSFQSRCELAPNMTILPGPFRYSQLTPDRIQRIIAEHFFNNAPLILWLSP